MSVARPRIVLKPREERRLERGHPWVYSNEIVMDGAAKALPAGALASLHTHDGRPLGTALFNPHTLIAARLIDRAVDVPIDASWFEARLVRAVALRAKTVGTPFCRLVHAEADGLPGLVVDRYGDVVVVEANSAGMDRLLDPLTAALERALSPRALVVASDSSARRLEGLDADRRLVSGALDGPVEVVENGVRFRADLGHGQKTGWFYDQRDNRAFMAGLARDARILDLYCYTGGFGLAAARAGAARVLGVDRSKAALALAAAAAELNGLGDRWEAQAGDVFEVAERLGAAGERYDIVMADPPAFAKARKDVGPALRGYRKLARLAAGLVAPGGFLFFASCSHHVTGEALLTEAQHALADLRRPARLVRAAGAAPDHPVHPALPESAYLKALVFAMD